MSKSQSMVIKNNIGMTIKTKIPKNLETLRIAQKINFQNFKKK